MSRCKTVNKTYRVQKSIKIEFGCDESKCVRANKEANINVKS